jgi:hypothetical protein
LIQSDATDVYSDGTRADYYGIIRYAMRGTKIDNGVKTPSWLANAVVQNGEGISTILVEHCYMQNNYSFINNDASLKSIAEADGKAIVSQYGLRKKSEIVSSVSIDKKEVELVPGESQKINATVLPDTATNKNVTWKSSDDSIVSVDANGNITANKPGVATITVTTSDGNKKDYCTVYSQEMTLSEDEVIMFDTDKRKINVTFINDTLTHKVNWSSDNTDVAIVSEDGTVTAVSKGTANITATVEGINLSKSIKFEITSLDEGQYFKIKDDLKEEDGVITKIPENISKEDFLKYFEFTDKLKIELDTENDLIGTNSKVIIKNVETDEILKKYVCLVYGDVNCDGKINSGDLLKIQKHLLKESIITNDYILKAADVNKDGVINSGDLLRIQKYLLKVVDKL